MVTPEEVLKLKKPTDKFLCDLDADIYTLEFRAFQIRDIASNKILFRMDDSGQPPIGTVEPMQLAFDDLERGIRYHFPSNFWNMQSIGTTLKFSIGGAPIKKFRMIERHYFKGKLIRSFDFKFGFVIPGSTNQWEAIYPVPKMSKKQREEARTSPWEMQSDSFFFDGDTLIKHNKAEYAYDL